MPTTITPQDYTAFLAMIKHEGENGIANLLKQGRDGDALGYVAGLIDTWTNRASASGLQPWQMMNRPYQITDWDSSTSAIQAKANSLPSNIKQLADAYLSARAEGAPQLNPGVNFYLNKDLVEATPEYGNKWRNWYDQSSVVNSFGDQRGGGRGSLQTQFVANPNEYQAKDTGIVFDKSLKVQPTDFGQGAYAKITGTASMGYDPARALNTGTTGLNTFDASEGAGPVNPGMVSDLGRAYETGDPFGFSGTNVSSGVGPGSNNLGGATPFGNVNPLAFGTGVNVGGGQPGAFNNFLPPTETGDPFGFTGLNVGGGTGNGSFGNGISPYGQPPGPNDFSNTNVSSGVGPGSLNPGLSLTLPSDTASTIGAPAASGGLPAFFSPQDYISANADLGGMSNQQAIDHYLNYGQFETRALAPWLQAQVHAAPGGSQTIGAPGLSPTLGPSTTPTVGSGSTASTIGAPNAISGLPPGFNEQAYLIANPDVAASGQSGADHFLRWGQFDVRSLGPGQEARVHAAPGSISPYGGTVQASTLGPFGTTPTLLPDGGISVTSPGLVPTQGPPGLTPTQGPGPTIIAQTGTFNPDEYLRANADVAASGQSALDHFRNYGAREGRAIDTLGNHFNGDAYLAANRDVAMAGLNPLEHFLRYGAQEARTLAPTDWASPLTAFTNAGTYGAPAATPTIGAPSLTPTQAPPDLSPTIGPTGLTPTYAPPAATPTLNPPMTTPTLGPGFTQPSYSPGGGISNPFGFSGANVGSGLGATNQSFATAYPLDTNIGFSSGGSPGGGGMSDYGFSGADVGGFDVNAASPPMEGGGGGGGGGGTAKGSSSSAAFLADQARTRAYWESLVKPADLYGNTNTHTTPVVGAPVVPNLTVTNAAMGAPGAMFSMFAPWR